MNHYFSGIPDWKAFLIYLLLLLGFTTLLSRYAGRNGDMPFYVACAIEKDQGTADNLIVRTREVLQMELPANEYKDQVKRFGEPDPVILERYRVKPFYILLVLALHKMGFSYVSASFIPSLVCYFLICISMWQFLKKRLEPLSCFLISIICSLIYPTLLLGRLSTPDAISCFVLLNAFFLIYAGRNRILWFSLFMFAVVVRLDNIVTELVFLFALWKWPVPGFTNKLKLKEFIILSATLIGAAAVVNLTATHQFFWFLNSQFSRPPGQYFREISLYFFVVPGSFFMSLFLLFVFAGLRKGYTWKLEGNYIFYMVCFVVLVRFILYPYYEERYYTPIYLFSLLTLAIQVSFGETDNQGLSPGVKSW
jgi:hypothetical protein